MVNPFTKSNTAANRYWKRKLGITPDNSSREIKHKKPSKNVEGQISIGVYRLTLGFVIEFHGLPSTNAYNPGY